MTLLRALAEAARYELLQVFRGRRALLFALFAGLPILLAFANPGTDRLDQDDLVMVAYFLFPGSTCMLLAIFYASPLLQSEIERKTFTYLCVRPVPRWQMLAGRLLGVLLALEAAVAVSVLAAWLAGGRPGGSGLLLATWQSSAAALLAYAPVTLALGAFYPGRAMIAGIAYGLVFENLLSMIPFVGPYLTVAPYLRGIHASALPAGALAGEFQDLLVAEGSPSVLWAHVLAIAAAGCLAASVAVTRKEYALADDV